MMMKSKLGAKYPGISFEEYNVNRIYIADFTTRTESARGLEISNDIPADPNTPTEKMGVLALHNDEVLTICLSMFDDHLFKDENGVDDTHCEGIFFPTNVEGDCWLSFLEIKDCKFKNIPKFKKKSKEQITHTVQRFRDDNIIENKQKVYGFISFPRNKTTFNDFILGGDIERTKFLKEHHIHMLASNNIRIVDSTKLEII